MFYRDAKFCVSTLGGNHSLPKRFPHIILDEFIIMPNHMHGFINIDRRGESCIRPNPADMGDHKDRPYGGTETCMVFLYPVSCIVFQKADMTSFAKNLIVSWFM